MQGLSARDGAEERKGGWRGRERRRRKKGQTRRKREKERSGEGKRKGLWFSFNSYAALSYRYCFPKVIMHTHIHIHTSTWEGTETVWLTEVETRAQHTNAGWEKGTQASGEEHWRTGLVGGIWESGNKQGPQRPALQAPLCCTGNILVMILK